MISAPIPADEEQRLEALRRYGILDTPPDPAFDRLTRLGSRVFGAPIVLISLVDTNRQWFKSCYGVEVTETGRHESFCAHAILSSEPLVIPSAEADPRFRDNPLVTGEPHIRFYAGAPLTTRDGRRLGTFCIIDVKPRPALTDDEIEMLQDFAFFVVEELEYRRSARELSQTERALRAWQTRFNAFMEHSPAAKFIKDEAGRVVYVNRVAEQTLSAPPTGWLGKTVEDIWPRDVAARARERDEKVMTTGEPVSSIDEVPGSDGSRQFLSFRFSFSDDFDGRFLGFIGVEITDRLHLEQNLRLLNEQLAEQTRRAEEASRLKSQFLANMSHELRTPLNGIIGFSELLYDGRAGELNERQKRYLNNILLSGRHLLQLINDLLDLAKIEAGKLELHPECASAGMLIGEVVESTRSLMDLKHLDLTVSIAPEADTLYVDPGRFRQVIYNFLSNAIKFTPEKGSIEVRAVMAGEQGVRIEVEDSGHRHRRERHRTPVPAIPATRQRTG